MITEMIPAYSQDTLPVYQISKEVIGGSSSTLTAERKISRQPFAALRV